MPSTSRIHYHGAVIAVGGPPHSGKSVFLAELYRQLLHASHQRSHWRVMPS